MVGDRKMAVFNDTVAWARALAEQTDHLWLKSWMAMESESHMYKGWWEKAVEAADKGLPFAWETRNWMVVLFSTPVFVSSS